jgi:hypothetical protein
MWSMPRSVLRVVAVIIGLCAVGGFVLGLRGTPEQGHLPGETPRGASAQALDAQDAKPLVDSVPQPVAKAEDKKKPEDKKPVDPLDAQAQALAPPTVAVPPPTAAKPKGPDDKVGDLLDAVSPPPEDPPH